jgi:hypothetical protein
MNKIEATSTLGPGSATGAPSPQPLDLLSKVDRADVQGAPYPHLIARDLLDADLVARLIAEFPDLGTITRGKPYASNERHSYAAHRLLPDPAVSQVWKDLVSAQLTQGFLDRFLDLFAPWISERYPQLKAPGMRAGIRRRDSPRKVDVLLESQICVNTPVTTTTSVRGPHVDMPDKLFAGLFYLRDPRDTAGGGDLQLHRYRHGPKCLRGQFIADADVEVVETVCYDSNVLVLFLNGIDAVHGVTRREPTPYPRMFLNLFGELAEPLFDLPRYQARDSLRFRAGHRLQMGRKRLAGLVHRRLS